MLTLFVLALLLFLTLKPQSAYSSVSTSMLKTGTVYEEVRLTASDMGAYDRFGNSVSMSGDRLAVGTMYADPSGERDAGAVYVYSRAAGDNWVEEARLTASDMGAYDRFGNSVSLSGDRLAVGTMYADPSGERDAGAVYVYSRDAGGNWEEEARLTASDMGAYDRFGNTVSLSGDRLAVGTMYTDPTEERDAGAVYVYSRDAGGNWEEEARLTASDMGAYDRFGNTVSMSSDRLAVGTMYTDPTEERDAGAVYVYRRDAGGNWEEEARLTASDMGAYDRFGNSVSLSGDRLAVGTMYTDPTEERDAGAVYVYRRDAGGNWEEEARLTASDMGAYDRFGNSVSLSGDRLAVGTMYADPSGERDAGAVYVYSRDAGGNWEEEARLTASDMGAYDRFGNSVSLSGDSLAVGTMYADPSGERDAGAVYVYRRDGVGN